MKKILFTLVALLTGMTAMAYNVEMRLVDNNGNPINEVHAKAGDKINLHMELTALDGVVGGFQMQYIMKDVNGDPIDVDGGPVVIAKVGGNYLRSEGMTKLVGNNNGNTTPEPGTYRALVANTGLNIVWTTDPQVIADVLGDDVEALFEDYDPPYTQSMFTLGNVMALRVEIKDGWDQEYAMLDFDNDFGRFAITDGSQFRGEFPDLDLKIINDDYVAPGLKDLTGEILIGDADENGYVTIEYTGEEDVTIVAKIDGVPVEIVDGKIFLGAYGEAEVTVEVTADGYNPMTATKTVNWEEPVTPPEPTDPPVITYETTDTEVIITATGNGTVTLYIDGVEVDNPYTIARGEEAYSVIATATAQEEDHELSAVTTLEILIPALEPVTPPEPVDLTGSIVVSEPNEDGQVTITYTGDEDVTITVNGEEYTGSFQLEDGENVLNIVVSGEGYNDLTETITITWTAPEPPADPHMVGKWLVIIDKNGEEHWYEMSADPDDPNWFYMITLHHNPWGDFDVPFYFMVDGVRMGAETDMYEPQMGDASQTILNPVYEGENLFCVPGTYTYTFGLQYKDGQWYLLVAQGAQTGIN